ncbi:MAG: NAD(P)-dependent oxidoreductase [Candidatus Micrarchaeota archaeon]|nr:NAD(P)-dependent oxidoreductase [Candidatus Micrarchaeota archaeon]
MALILVTGATGKIGGRVAAALIAKGDKVRAVVRPGSKGILPARAEKYEHDLSIAPLPADAFKGVQKIAHLAGLVGSHSQSALEAANAVAVNSLLYNCPKTVQRIVLASSISVYGEYKGKIADETFEARGESPYGKSKLAGEREARNFCPCLPITFLRIAMVYGPGFKEGYFDILRYVDEGKMKIIGDGKNRMPLVHVDGRAHTGRTFFVCCILPRRGAAKRAHFSRSAEHAHEPLWHAREKILA